MKTTTSIARQYASSLLDRILFCMRPRHPLHCFLGYISLETRYSLETVEDALLVLQERNLVHRLDDDEKIARGLRVEFDVYILTEEGYKSSNKE